MGLKNKDVKVGDLVLLNAGHMKSPPRGPVIVLKITPRSEALCEVMYLSDNYVHQWLGAETGIEKVVTLEASGLV